ncbi:MAG: PAS domain S-box protein, partial [Candidatus Atribacteria bacterium]|nr:PAS domain S-box protein [Candidatus Atribacteria bacterium]
MPKKPTSRTQKQLLAENEDLRARLAEAEETLRAIRSGEVDALVVPGVGSDQIFTLKGADHSYRLLIEEMNDGALTLTAEGVILYANRRFAEMLKTPLEKVIGSTIHTWIPPEGQRILQSLLRKGVGKKHSEQLVFTASDGTLVQVNLSVSNLPIENMPDSFCLVATDLTEQIRS